MLNNIGVVGLGFVGNAVADFLRGRCKTVVGYDISEEACLKATVPASTARSILSSVDALVICLPTSSNEHSRLDTLNIERFMEDVPEDVVVIVKSTVPVGFTSSLNRPRTVFCPEFLTEEYAAHDIRHPSRVVVGGEHKLAEEVAELFQVGRARVIITTTDEAEAIKLFSNAYLAMRVAFFNEIDSTALINDMDTTQIIRGVCADPRIGEGYNRPSFGFGGYCLPKDTEELYRFTEFPLLEGALNSNFQRTEILASHILGLGYKTYGVNWEEEGRYSATSGLAKLLYNHGMLEVSLENAEIVLSDKGTSTSAKMYTRRPKTSP